MNASFAVRCIALRQRSSVDLPQPDGPMSAVTALRLDREVDARDDRALAEAGGQVTTSMRRAGPWCSAPGSPRRRRWRLAAGLVFEDSSRRAFLV